MSENGRDVIVDVQNVKMIYNAKNRDESTHVHALRGLSVQVYENEFFAIMGPSGSGKSTLFNMIGALDRPTSGRIRINEVDLSALSSSELAFFRNNYISYIFQAFNLLPSLTALRNVALPMLFKGIAPREAEQKAAHPAGRFGDPAEFGDACAYLCSAQAGFITGQNFLIDGGNYPGTL